MRLFRTFSPSRAVAVALSLALLGGCSLLPSVGPDYTLPSLKLPAGWYAASTETQPQSASRQELAQWWRRFDDATLNALIDEALAGSTDLRLAQARLRQARASRRQAIGDYFPTLSASANPARSKSARTVGAGSERTLYDAGFDAAWEIDLFGGTRRAVEAATADLAASQADLDNARVSLVAEVVENYAELRSYQQRLQIARANLDSQGETRQITEWRYQAGLASASDVEQARTNLEQTRASIPDLEIGLVEAKNRLAVLAGQAPGALNSRLAEVRPLPAVPAAVATGIPADVLRQRPDLIAAERTLAAETARVGQKLAQRFPSLSLSGTFGWQAYSLAALGGGDALFRSLSGTLAATLFDGGRLRAAVEVQNAVQEQALVSYEAAVLGALEEVENALTAHARAYERLQARRAAAEAARNAAQLTRQMYQSGLSDFQKVLETERTRLSAEDSLATAEATLLTSLVKLYKSLGGGWEQPAAGNSNPEQKS